MIKLITPAIFAAALSVPACAAVPTQLPANTPVPAKAQVGTVQMAQAEPTAQHFKPTQQERFDKWKAGFMARAIAKGYDEALVKRAIANVKINPLALERDKSQPEFTRPIWSYVDGAANATRLKEGREKLSETAGVYDAIEARYGVDRYVLTGIWGLESSYGKILGTHNILDALSTFAFEGRRTAFGESQLFACLDLLASGQVRLDQLTGSWAGAMGMTQFIPATFRDYAVDFDGNGNIDMWTDPGDALGSAAHYLSRHGWRASEPILAEVSLPAGFDYGLSNGTKRTIAGWTALGVRPIGGQNWSQDAMFLDAKLLVPAGANGPVFLTFKNFDVIKKYNNSTSYALGITVLAETLQGNTPITKDWPRSDKPLSLTDKKNLQSALTRQGFDTKGIDGQIGPNSMRAIRAWQRANGLPADGYVNQAVLKTILAK